MNTPRKLHIGEYRRAIAKAMEAGIALGLTTRQLYRVFGLDPACYDSADSDQRLAVTLRQTFSFDIADRCSNIVALKAVLTKIYPGREAKQRGWLLTRHRAHLGSQTVKWHLIHGSIEEQHKACTLLYRVTG